MHRTFLILALLLISTAAEARVRHHRPVVTITQPDHWVPGTGLYWFSQNICSFVAWSVAPDWPIERQQMMLGSCPPRPAPRYS